MAGRRSSVPVARVLLVALACASAACIEVPDKIRAHFAEPRADERSNYRKGPHGTAPPNEDAPEAPAPKEATATTTSALVDASDVARADGGAP